MTLPTRCEFSHGPWNRQDLDDGTRLYQCTKCKALYRAVMVDGEPKFDLLPDDFAEEVANEQRERAKGCGKSFLRKDLL